MNRLMKTPEVAAWLKAERVKSAAHIRRLDVKADE